MPTQENTRLEPAGPFTFESIALDPGDRWRVWLRSEQNGRYRRYLPFDSLLVKNYDANNRIQLYVNGGGPNVPRVDVDPSGKDSYDESGVSAFVVENLGGSTIAAEDVTVTVKKDGYGADERAREAKQQGPVSQIVEHVSGLRLG